MIWPMRQVSGNSCSLRPGLILTLEVAMNPPAIDICAKMAIHHHSIYAKSTGEDEKCTLEPRVKERYHSNKYEFKYERWWRYKC